MSSISHSIADRYLGEGAGERFAAQRASKPGVLLELSQEQPRIWSLAGMLSP